jgi:hypothetical protein
MLKLPDDRIILFKSFLDLSIEEQQLFMKNLELVNGYRNNLEESLMQWKEKIFGKPEEYLEAGGSEISDFTWERATRLLWKIMKQLWAGLFEIPNPLILASPDGSIDLEWNQEDFDLLINIPMNEKEMISAYGKVKSTREDLPEQELEVILTDSLMDQVIIEWLKQTKQK